MADAEFKSEEAFKELSLAYHEAQGAYHHLLELCGILEAFDTLERPPAWAYPLARMAERARDLADSAHVSASRAGAAAFGQEAWLSGLRAA